MCGVGGGCADEQAAGWAVVLLLVTPEELQHHGQKRASRGAVGEQDAVRHTCSQGAAQPTFGQSRAVAVDVHAQLRHHAGPTHTARGEAQLHKPKKQVRRIGCFVTGRG